MNIRRDLLLSFERERGDESNRTAMIPGSLSDPQRNLSPTQAISSYRRWKCDRGTRWA